MTAAIEILSGELLGRSYQVDEMPFSIGRKDDCAIVIPKKYFSRRHAEIVRKGSGFAIRGLSEKNPVILNDEEVEEHGLQDRDEFEICGVRFRFRAEGRGASRAEREIEKQSGVQASLSSRAQQSKTSTARRSRDERGRDDGRDRDDHREGGGRNGAQRSAAEDIDDGPLDGGPLDGAPGDGDFPGDDGLDEATEQRPAKAKGRGHSDLDDGDLPDDLHSGSKPQGSGAGDLDDGPLPGEGSGGGERFDFGSGDAPPPSRSSSAKPPKSGGTKTQERSQRGSQAKRAGSDDDARESIRADGAPGWKAAAADGPRGGERVVFGDDDASANGKGAAASPAKKSKASGSGDENERTDQIDISKLKKDDDPFAPDQKKLVGKDPATIAAREKFLKVLVAVGLGGILLAGGIIYKIGQPLPNKYFDCELGTCGVNETKLFNPLLNEDDPPEGVDRTTPVNGNPTSIVEVKEPTIAHVEWAVPSTPHVALFLVTGISEGTTSFQLTSHANVTTIYHVRITGMGPHDLAKKKRQEALGTLTDEELKKKVEKFLSEGDQLKKEIERNPNLTDKYVRQILASYEKADETCNVLAALIDKSGVSDPTQGDRQKRVRESVDSAKDAWEKERDHTRTAYVDLVSKSDYQPALAQLKMFLNILGDHCSADYQRFQLILEKKYKITTFKDVGCIEEDPR